MLHKTKFGVQHLILESIHAKNSIQRRFKNANIEVAVTGMFQLKKLEKVCGHEQYY